MPLTPAVFHILLALAEGDRHGYDIMRLVDDVTEGRLKLGPGTLYGTIKRMLRDRLIVEAGDRPDPALDDARRRYYRLTDAGRAALGAELHRLNKLVTFARRRGFLNALASSREEST